MTRILPDDAVAYAKTAIFTPDTVPEKLLHHHNIKADSWGVLTVIAGQVSYFVEDQKEPTATIIAGDTFIILPEEKHYVRLSQDAQFFVAFHKRLRL